MARIRSGPIEGDEEYSAGQCFEETWTGGFETQDPNGLLVSRNLNPMACTYILLVGRSPGEMLVYISVKLAQVSGLVRHFGCCELSVEVFEGGIGG